MNTQTENKKDKKYKTINLELSVYQKMRNIQTNLVDKSYTPSFSWIVNMLMEKNKKYRQQLNEVKDERSDNTN